MRGTPIKHMDEMELIQSVSRSGGDGAEGDAYVSLYLLVNHLSVGFKIDYPAAEYQVERLGDAGEVQKIYR